MLHIGVLSLDFHLPGCASLKDKRRRLARLRERFGRNAGLAVCESGCQESHRRARWDVLAVAGDAVVVERALADVERWVGECLDAEVVGLARERISRGGAGETGVTGAGR